MADETFPLTDDGIPILPGPADLEAHNAELDRQQPGYRLRAAEAAIADLLRRVALLEQGAADDE
jgi:hypothetical protein